MKNEGQITARIVIDVLSKRYNERTVIAILKEIVEKVEEVERDDV